MVSCKCGGSCPLSLLGIFLIVRLVFRILSVFFSSYYYCCCCLCALLSSLPMIMFLLFFITIAVLFVRFSLPLLVLGLGLHVLVLSGLLVSSTVYV